VISVEQAFLIAKFNIIILAVILIYIFKTDSLKTSEFKVVCSLIFGVFVGYYILQNASFYDFYLYAAASNLFIVGVSILAHNFMKAEKSKTVYLIYGLLFFKFLLHMLLYRVRVIIYDSDEPIMWLINGQSFAILFCDLLIVLVLALQVSKWKLRYMQFS